MTFVLKSALLLGAFALLAPGVAARLLGREALGPWARASWALGAALLVVASLGGALATTSALAGGLDWGLALEYLRHSRYGHLTLLRLGLAAALLALGARRGHGMDALFGLAALGFLATLSLTAHAGASGRAWPLVADLLHLSAAALWLGAVSGLAFARAPERRAVGRVSQTGLASVLVLALSGVYSAALHLTGLADLTSSAYGQALLVKLALVAIILSIAALNRWWLLPRHARSGEFLPLRRAVRLELLLLAAVLVATGVLSSTEPP